MSNIDKDNLHEEAKTNRLRVVLGVNTCKFYQGDKEITLPGLFGVKVSGTVGDFPEIVFRIAADEIDVEIEKARLIIDGLGVDEDEQPNHSTPIGELQEAIANLSKG